MDKEKIINEGLLEQYILGDLPEALKHDLESIIASDKELKSYLDLLEIDFEHLAMDNSITPPAHLKKKLLNSIKVVDLKSEAISSPKESFKSYKSLFAIAASVALALVLSTALLLKNNSSIESKLSEIENETKTIKQKNLQLTEILSEKESTIAFLSNPDTEQYILSGNALMPNAKLVSYVNHKEKRVVVNTQKLPELDVDQDYQLWADVEGEMINMGVISKNNELLTMTYIEDAESLNVTIEPKGGSEHPTVSRLISNVYLNTF